MPGPVFIGGHSLAAARAWEYAYSRFVRGLRVDGVYALAPPNPGNRAIGMLAQKQPPNVVLLSLKNRRDLVTDVPVDIELLGEECVQPVPFTEIDQPPPAGDSWGVFADHHIGLYVAGANALPANAAAITLGDAAGDIARLYQSDAGWDWVNPVDGQYCAMRRYANTARLMIFRGSVTEKDWLDDFDAVQIKVMGAMMSQGFWAGIGPIIDRLDGALA